MPIDLPPPVVVKTISEPATEIADEELYGPIDTKQAEQRDSGTAKQPAPECPQGSENVIVVCAPTDPGQYRLAEIPPPGETSWNVLDRATTIKLGPAEIQPEVLGLKGLATSVKTHFGEELSELLKDPPSIP